MYFRGSYGVDLVHDFRKHCPNVMSLNIAEEGGSLWANTIEIQQEILDTENSIPKNIAEHGLALRELKMYNYTCNSEILQRIGERLENLVIYDFLYDLGDNDVGMIKLHCPNLKSISLEDENRVFSPDITRLLASYGDLLENARLSYLHEEQIRNVTTACPNARFHLFVDVEYGLSPSALNLIGSRLDGVRINFRSIFTNVDLVEWANAWNQCVNLRHLNITPRKVEDIQAVFSMPKTHLITIELGVNGWFKREDLKKVMDYIANGTKCIENFECSGSPYFIDALDDFIEKNRSTLRVISLDNRNGDDNKKLDESLQEKFDELLKSFHQLPVLEELYVDYGIPQDIRLSLRNNGVHHRYRKSLDTCMYAGSTLVDIF